MSVQKTYSFPAFGIDATEDLSYENIETAIFFAKLNRQLDSRELMKACMEVVQQKLDDFVESNGEGSILQYELKKAIYDRTTAQQHLKSLAAKIKQAQHEVNQEEMVIAQKEVDFKNQASQLDQIKIKIDSGLGEPNEAVEGEVLDPTQQQELKNQKEALEKIQESKAKEIEDLKAVKLNKGLDEEVKRIEDEKKIADDKLKGLNDHLKPLRGKVNLFLQLEIRLRSIHEFGQNQLTSAQIYELELPLERNMATVEICKSLDDESKAILKFIAGMRDSLAHKRLKELKDFEFKEQDQLAQELTKHVENLAQAELSLKTVLGRYNALLADCHERKFKACAKGKTSLYQTNPTHTNFKWSNPNFELIVCTKFRRSIVKSGYCVAMPLLMEAPHKISTTNGVLKLFDNDEESPMRISEQFKFDGEPDAQIPEALLWHQKKATQTSSKSFQVAQQSSIGSMLFNAKSDQEDSRCHTVIAYRFNKELVAKATSLKKFWTELFTAANRTKSHTLCVPFPHTDAMMQGDTVELFAQLILVAKTTGSTWLRKVVMIVPEHKYQSFDSYAMMHPDLLNSQEKVVLAIGNEQNAVLAIENGPASLSIADELDLTFKPAKSPVSGTMITTGAPKVPSYFKPRPSQNVLTKVNISPFMSAQAQGQENGGNDDKSV